MHAAGAAPVLVQHTPSHLVQILVQFVLNQLVAESSRLQRALSTRDATSASGTVPGCGRSMRTEVLAKDYAAIHTLRTHTAAVVS